MLSRLFSATIVGLSGVLIEVEVDVANRGFPTFTIVGLPDKSIDEAKDRVRTAITNSSYEMPDSRITVNLAPADIPKVGSGFDLPIALGVLAANGVVSSQFFLDSLFIGELSLHGTLRKVTGMISLAILAREKNIRYLFLPEENAQEAASIEGITIFPIKNLKQLIAFLNQEVTINPYVPVNEVQEVSTYDFDFADIKGQELAKRAFQIASAGFHNIHLAGPPGAGKTMLARAFPSILLPLEHKEVIEVSQIYSVAGLLNGKGLLHDRPFRSPHHTTSRTGLIGGGSIPVPGEISLAHRGILFLDEFPEFSHSTLEALRQPMEDGEVTISRASGSTTFPCKFLLVAASNPCPCGYLNHPTKPCTCSPISIAIYKKKISGPMLDRIDLHVDVLPVEESKLLSYSSSNSSQQLKAIINEAHLRQETRFKGSPYFHNSEMSSAFVKNTCKFTTEASTCLRRAISSLNLSARSYFKVIKVAQTIADLDRKERIEYEHISEAIQFRSSSN